MKNSGRVCEFSVTSEAVPLNGILGEIQIVEPRFERCKRFILLEAPLYTICLKNDGGYRDISIIGKERGQMPCLKTSS